MPSSPSEPKGFFDGFDFWDWFVIYLVSDMGSAGIMAFVTAGSITLALALAPILWWLHLAVVRKQIKDGTR